MTDPTDDLRHNLDALIDRVSRLEAAAETTAEVVVDAADQFWALNALHATRGDHPATADGVVMLVGSLTLPDGAPVAWQQSAATAGMIDGDWADSAATFAALGHPVRLELLRQVLSGVHTTADLTEAAALGTTGQLHHHLRQLVAAGWVHQTGRGTYEVPASRVVPLLVCLAGVR